jgi:hypothetical protein
LQEAAKRPSIEYGRFLSKRAEAASIHWRRLSTGSEDYFSIRNLGFEDQIVLELESNQQIGFLDNTI